MKDICIKIKRPKNSRHALFICIVVLSVFSKNVNAQLGIKIGTTASSFYYTDINPVPYKGFDIDLRPYLGFDIELVQTGDQKPLFSPYVSVFYTFNLTKRLGLRPELGFTQKGVNFSQFDYERIIYKVKISYIEIPLSVTYQILQKENSISELYFGGYAAYRINAIKKVASNNSSIKKIKVNSVSNFDTGLHLGVNYKHKFFLIDFRFFMGLNNIFEKPENWTNIYFSTQKTKITGINISVGYEF
jgi:hypothetical protein